MRYVEIMKCPKDEQVIFGIIGGIAHHIGMRPNKLRFILSLLAFMVLLVSTQAFLMSLLCYGVSYFFTPRYEEMYDKEVTPDAQPPDLF